MALCTAAAAWSCSSFDASTAENGDAGESGALEAASDSPSTDSSTPDTRPVVAPSPCPGDGGIVFFSTFDDGAGLAGWTIPPVAGNASMTPFATDAGGVARGSILGGNAGAAYAVITRGTLPQHFAVRFSFAVSSLQDSYIVHQALDQTNASNLALALRAGSWTLGVFDKSVVVGAAGAAGAWHTLTYRFEGAQDGGGVGEAQLDLTPSVTLDLGSGTGIYTLLQLGPFWPVSSAPEPLVVDYDDVTVWDCSK